MVIELKKQYHPDTSVKSNMKCRKKPVSTHCHEVIPT